MRLLFVSLSPRGIRDSLQALPSGPEELDVTGQAVYLWPGEMRALQAAVGLAAQGNEIVFCTRRWQVEYAGVRFVPLQSFPKVFGSALWDAILAFGSSEPFAIVEHEACIFDFHSKASALVGTGPLRGNSLLLLAQSEAQGAAGPSGHVPMGHAIPYYVLPGGYDQKLYAKAFTSVKGRPQRVGYWSRPGPLLKTLLLAPPADLHVFGLRPEYDAPWIEACRKAGAVVHPPLSPEWLVKEQAQCRVVVADAVEGDFSRAIAEAFALGCYVITRDTEANREYWGSHPVYLDHPALLAEAIETGLLFTAEAAWSENVSNQHKIVSNWGWSLVVERIRDAIMYGRTLSGTVGHGEAMQATTGVPMMLAQSFIEGGG